MQAERLLVERAGSRPFLERDQAGHGVGELAAGAIVEGDRPWARFRRGHGRHLLDSEILRRAARQRRRERQEERDPRRSQ
jgi:hypothetical protein